MRTIGFLFFLTFIASCNFSGSVSAGTVLKLQDESDESAFIEAARNGDIAKVKELLKAGVDVDVNRIVLCL